MLRSVQRCAADPGSIKTSHLFGGPGSAEQRTGRCFASSGERCTASGTRTLSPSRRDAAVDGEDHARRISGAVGGEECHQVADLPRICRTAERQALLEFLVTVFVAEL